VNMSVDNDAGAAGVTVLRLDGDLDAASYESLIEKGRELYAAGTRKLLVDMRGVGFMGSSGLVALHSVALILQGRQPPDPEHGWAAFHAMSDGTGDEPQVLKVLGPQPSVLRALERTGMTRFIEVHDDEQAALRSY
jgi:anti-anti-sigma regulatory factor